MAAIIGIAAAILQAQPSPPAPTGTGSDYVKIEVRGDLEVASDYKFAPQANPRTDLGVAVVAAPKAIAFGTPYRYELLIEDRKHYEAAIASDKKKVVVVGELLNTVKPSAPNLFRTIWPVIVSIRIDPFSPMNVLCATLL